MKRGVAFLFLTCSFMLVLGHSILPHDHVEEEHRSCKITPVKALSLADIIQLSLAHDLGANHLEEYTICNPITFVPASPDGVFLVAHLPVITDRSFEPTTQTFPPTCSYCTSPQLYLSTGLRAPPSQS